jgi:hypothetical protein
MLRLLVGDRMEKNYTGRQLLHSDQIGVRNKYKNLLKNLGENGMFRIKRGNDECSFESNIVAGLNRVKIISYFGYRNSWRYS